MTHPGLHIVACPRPLTQAEQVALALAEGNLLASYVTGFVWPAFLPDRLLAHAFRMLTGRAVSGGIDRRRVHSVPPHLVRSIYWLDVGRSCAAALNLPSAADYLWEIEDIRFAKAVCRFLSRCEGVHGFEHSSLEFFRAARREGRRTVLHLASVHPGFKERVLNQQYVRYPELKKSTDYRLHMRCERRDARRLQEFELADLIVTCSAFATRTLVEEGISPERVATVPLGAPPLSPLPPGTESSQSVKSRFTVLFAGSLSVHKGGHILLEAWERAKIPGGRLLLAGHTGLHADMVRRAGVEVLGTLSQARLFQLMQECDVLALPTLIDSFALVITEALAHGLPVITTANAGASEFIEEDVNGWVLPAGDVEALTERLVWCADHREQVQQMRPAARQSARQISWAEFRQRLRESLSARGLIVEPAVA